MALAHCRECSAEVSTEADQCPKCGAKFPTLKSAYREVAFFVVALGIMGAIFVYREQVFSWLTGALFS